MNSSSLCFLLLNSSILSPDCFACLFLCSSFLFRFFFRALILKKHHFAYFLETPSGILNSFHAFIRRFFYLFLMHFSSAIFFSSFISHFIGSLTTCSNTSEWATKSLPWFIFFHHHEYSWWCQLDTSHTPLRRPF